MSMHKLQIGFFLLVMTLVSVLAYLVIAPLFTVVFLSIILVVVFHPLHERIRAMIKQKTVSSIVSTLLIILVIIIPLSIIGTLLVQEAVELYETTVVDGATDGVLETTMTGIERFVNARVEGLDLDISQHIDVADYSERTLGWIVGNLSDVFSGVLKGLFAIVLLILSVFYLLRDGEWFSDKIMKLSPLEDGYDRKILAKLKLAINSVIRGHIVIGIVQGVLTGVGLALFGVPSPVVWGFIAAIASLIPTIGTGLVLVPAVLFVFFTSGLVPALGLALWGAIAVGLVDNLLGPILIERGIKIHPFIILLSVLGGLQLFGPIGFIAGPVVVALLIALLEIYPMILEPLPSNK